MYSSSTPSFWYPSEFFPNTCVPLQTRTLEPNINGLDVRDFGQRGLWSPVQCADSQNEQNWQIHLQQRKKELLFSRQRRGWYVCNDGILPCVLSLGRSNTERKVTQKEVGVFSADDQHTPERTRPSRQRLNKMHHFIHVPRLPNWGFSPQICRTHFFVDTVPCVHHSFQPGLYNLEGWFCLALHGTNLISTVHINPKDYPRQHNYHYTGHVHLEK